MSALDSAVCCRSRAAARSFASDIIFPFCLHAGDEQEQLLMNVYFLAGKLHMLVSFADGKKNKDTGVLVSLE